jgi:hypothetical protein
MSKFQNIGWSLFNLNSRVDEISTSISEFSSINGRDVLPFTPQSDSRGNCRAGIHNPYIEHKKFFNDILSGERKLATAVNYGMLLRHQLNIEFSNRTGLSTPSKTSIINDCGQYFYREVFTKLFTPIIRGYKVDENKTRNSTYSFYKYTKWLYSFINMKFLKHQRDQLFLFLKEALVEMHNFFMQELNIPTTSLISIIRGEALGFPSGGLSGKPRKFFDENKIEKIPLCGASAWPEQEAPTPSYLEPCGLYCLSR